MAGSAVIVAMIKFIPQRGGIRMEQEQRMQPDQQQQLDQIQETVNDLSGDMKVVNTRLTRSDMDITAIRGAMDKNAELFQRQLDAIRAMLVNLIKPGHGPSTEWPE